jgi:hypothetical protein
MIVTCLNKVILILYIKVSSHFSSMRGEEEGGSLLFVHINFLGIETIMALDLKAQNVKFTKNTFS